jgi:hypothetical protein
MNIVICHGYAHRLRNDNLVESAPVFEDINDNHDFEVGAWEIRTQEEMDLSGGDNSVIKDTLVRFRDIFSFAGRRTPVSQTVQAPVGREPSQAL